MKSKKSAAKSAPMKKAMVKTKPGTLGQSGNTKVKRSGKGKMC